MHKFKLKSHFNEWATWLDLNYITYGLETLMKMNLSQVQQKQTRQFSISQSKHTSNFQQQTITCPLIFLNTIVSIPSKNIIISY
jgi:hypothetical protein